MDQPRRTIVVFDLGGVLVDWDPRHLYRKLFDDAAAMERFLTDICSPEWNLRQDAGRALADGTAELVARHPAEAALIEAFYGRWTEMLAGPIAGTVAILRALRDRGVPLYALTNWSAETFGVALERYAFLAWFRDIVVSGREGLIKPDPRFFRLALDRWGVPAASIVFIDDNPANAAAATALGMQGIRFETPAALRAALVDLGLLDAGGTGA